ncbi:hypothetical protein ACSBR2_029321 [Camellia fascicularis]
MASTIPKQSSAKQLGELLQEQQEPFILEIYLLEKGYMKNKLNLQSGFRNSNSRFLNKLTTRGSNRKRKVVPTCPKIVRAALKKLVSISNKQTMKNSVDGDGESCAKQEKPESDGLSSASLQTWRSPISLSDQELNINSFFESNIEDGLNSLPRDSVSVTADTCRSFKLGDILQEKEVVTDGKIQWGCGEDKKQLSPVSVLEEIHYNEGSLLDSKGQRNANKYSIIAVPCSNFITRFNEPSFEAERVLHEPKQLLSESTDVRTWSNTTQPMNLDFTASVAEWSDFEPRIREIGAEIGDVILNDISKEIVADMMELVAPRLCQATSKREAAFYTRVFLN